MARRRRHYRRNPSQTTWLLIGGAVVIAGVGYYFYSKKATPTTPTTPTNPSTAKLSVTTLPPDFPPGLKMLLEDPTTSQACKDKVLAQAPLLSQYGALLTPCMSNPSGAGCDKLPGLQAQVEALQNEFNKVCA
jgi:hypothetical protein